MSFAGRHELAYLSPEEIAFRLAQLGYINGKITGCADAQAWALLKRELDQLLVELIQGRRLPLARAASDAAHEPLPLPLPPELAAPA